MQRLLPISPGWPGLDLLRAAERLLEGGCGALLLREPGLDEAALIELTEKLRPLLPGLILHARCAGALSLARRLGLPLHLPGSMTPRSAASLGVPRVGWSAHSVEDVAAAAEAGVDYVLVSPVARSSKPGDERPPLSDADLARVVALQDSSGVGAFGLGGVDAARARALRAAGLYGVAAMGAVFPPQRGPHGERLPSPADVRHLLSHSS